MIKKIIEELEAMHGEKFECTIYAKTYEFYSENHLYVYNRKNGELRQNF